MIGVAAGNLRHKITFQARTETLGEYGDRIYSWVDYAAGVRAEVKPLKGRELIAAQAAHSAVTVRFRVRFIPGLSAAMRIVHDSKNYNISAIVDTDEMHHELVIMAESGLNEG